MRLIANETGNQAGRQALGAPIAPRIRTGTNWPAVLLVTGAGVVSAFQFGKPSVALPALQASLGLGIGPVSWLLSAFALVGALLGLWIGLRVDAWGARRMLLAGLATQAVASGLGGLASTFPWLLGWRVVEGVGFLAVVVAGPALVHQVSSPRGRDRAFATWGTFMPVGMAALMLVAPQLQPLGWEGLWLANAGLLAAYALIFAWAAPRIDAFAAASRQSGRPRQAPAAAATAPGLRHVLASRAPWLVAALFVSFTAMFFSVFTFLPAILSERLGMAPQPVGWLSAVAVVMSALGTLACGFLLGRGIAPQRLLIWGFLVMGGASPAVLLPSLPGGLAYMAALLVALASGLVPVILFAAAARHAPSAAQVGTTVGMAMQGNNLGLLLGPAVAGAIVARWDWGWVAGWVCLLGVVALVLVLALQSVRPPESA